MADLVADLMARVAGSDAAHGGHAHRAMYYANGVRWMCDILAPDMAAATRETYVQTALIFATPLMRLSVMKRDLRNPEVRLLVRLIFYRLRLPQHGADSLAVDADWEAWFEAL